MHFTLTVNVENVLFYATKVLERTAKVVIRGFIVFLLLMSYLNMKARRICWRLAVLNVASERSTKFEVSTDVFKEGSLPSPMNCLDHSTFNYLAMQKTVQLLLKVAIKTVKTSCGGHQE